MIPAYPEMMDKEDMKSMIRRKEFDQELEEPRTLLKQMGEHVGAHWMVLLRVYKR